jgi:acetyltransferase-like isoleucine patch superfamily enzyme
MPIVVRDAGQRNHIGISAADLRDGEGLIELNGDDNDVQVETPHVWGLPHIMVGGNARVSIGRGCVLGKLFIYAGSGAEVEIGAMTGFSGTAAFAAHEPARIAVGDGCLFGAETHVLASDMHSIIDIDSGHRINPARDVIIGDRVWVGFRSVLLKGARIGEGTIIGAGSIVTGAVPARCAAAGNPARVLRQDVTWTQALLPMPIEFFAMEKERENV